MSMNQYMHIRNIYREPPDFKQLALDYPEFRKYVKQDITGKVTFDFKNVEALRALTCTLLKKDFDLRLVLPLNKLIPTVPLRLNYILWVEDLLSIAPCTDKIHGIDIGTGASCIYPLIAARKNDWTMTGTEIDEESIQCARNNVRINNLEESIEIVKVSGSTLLEEVCASVGKNVDFCMCNPPFFSSLQELNPTPRRSDRPKPKNAFCATPSEVVCKGGEVDYVSKLIRESKKLDQVVKIYTTMLGNKSSLPHLKTLLREVEVVSFKETEFCQGNTTRWGLAWTYSQLDLRQIPENLKAAKKKTPKPLYYELPVEGEDSKITKASERLRTILNSIEINLREVKRTKHYVEFLMLAEMDTWSHQRRKKREQKRFDNDKVKTENNNEEMETTCDLLAELDVKVTVDTNPKKRNHEDEYEVLPKKIKTLNKTDEPHLKAKISLDSINDKLVMQLIYLEGIANVEALHQILQFIKNKFPQ